MQTFLTIISGANVFILGQLVLKLILEPVQEFRNTVADVAMALFEHESIYANPGCVNEEMSKKSSADLRKLASKLNAQTYLIPYYNLTAKLLKLPLQIDILNSVRNLIGISNGIFSATHYNVSIINIERANQVRQMLNIDSCLKDDDSKL